jgi:hypothetical protein
MNDMACLVKISEIIEELVYKFLLSGENDTFLFYTGMVERKYDPKTHRQSFYDKAYKKANELIKRLETNPELRLTDNLAIQCLLAFKLLDSGKEDQKVREINNYLLKRSEAIESSPLEDLLNLFFLSYVYEYLDPNLTERCITYVGDLLKEYHRNNQIQIPDTNRFVLLIASKLNFRNKEGLENFYPTFNLLLDLTERIINKSDEEFERLIELFWLYETKILPYISSCSDLESALKQKIEKAILNVRRSAIPLIIKKLHYNELEYYVSPFDIVFIYEIILSNKDSFIIISSQELDNLFVEKNAKTSLQIVKWQTIAWIFSLTIFFYFVPLCLGRFQFLSVRIVCSLGIFLHLFIASLRLKHKKHFYLERREWLQEQMQSILSSLFLLSLLLYLGLIIFPLEIAQREGLISSLLSIILSIISYIKEDLKKAIKNLLFG